MLPVHALRDGLRPRGTRPFAQHNMDKYLTTAPSTDASHKKRKLPAGTGQLTLHQCKKTVTLHGHTAMNFTNDDLLACKRILEDASSSSQKLEQLRKLSVMHVNKAHLVESQVGRTVRSLAKCEDTDVARLAQRVLDKWKAQVLKHRSPVKRSTSIHRGSWLRLPVAQSSSVSGSTTDASQ